MASIVGICNSALVKLGATRIVQLTEGSKNANLCSEQFEKVRDDLLRSHVWNFAIKRAKLAMLAETPAFGFDAAFQLPSDFLRVASVHPDAAGGATTPYRIEGRQLLSNAGSIYLRYIYRVTDPNAMDVHFREALAWALALDLSIPITQSNSMRQMMDEGLRMQLAKAKSVDAIEDYPEAEPATAWVAERA
jgi:hypothetical protein